MATITTCDRCGVAGAGHADVGEFTLSAINDVNLSVMIDLCEGCDNKLAELIRTWWWEVQKNNAQTGNAVSG